MSNKDKFERKESEKCHYCNASEFVDCVADCPSQFSAFGSVLPESLRGLITNELLKQAEYIYERKQYDWYNGMLMERVESVMKEWNTFITFVKVLREIDHFKNVDDLINFIEKPSQKNDIFLLWTEMGSPTVPQTKHWEMFENILKHKKKKDSDGRTSKETEQ